MNTHFRIAITGGIGSGKSYVCSKLAERGIKVYDCDAAAKRIITHDHTLQTKLSEVIGEEVVKNGVLQKPVLTKSSAIAISRFRRVFKLSVSA